MVAMKIFYPNAENSRFDMDYYMNHHMKMVEELAGSLCKGVAIEGAMSESDSPYRVIGTEYFETVEDYHKALDPHRDMLRKDISNFTDILPVIQFFEVKRKGGCYAEKEIG